MAGVRAAVGGRRTEGGGRKFGAGGRRSEGDFFTQRRKGNSQRAKENVFVLMGFVRGFSFSPIFSLLCFACFPWRKFFRAAKRSWRAARKFLGVGRWGELEGEVDNFGDGAEAGGEAP